MSEPCPVERVPTVNDLLLQSVHCADAESVPARSVDGWMFGAAELWMAERLHAALARVAELELTPGDRLYRASEGTWWACNESGTFVRADCPPHLTLSFAEAELERLRADRVQALEDRQVFLDKMNELRAERDSLKASVERAESRRWEREDAWDRKLGGKDLDEILEERRRLRAGLREIAQNGTHGWDAVARRLLGDPS